MSMLRQQWRGRNSLKRENLGQNDPKGHLPTTSRVAIQVCICRRKQKVLGPSYYPGSSRNNFTRDSKGLDALLPAKFVRPSVIWLSLQSTGILESPVDLNMTVFGLWEKTLVAHADRSLWDLNRGPSCCEATAPFHQSTNLFPRNSKISNSGGALSPPQKYAWM